MSIYYDIKEHIIIKSTEEHEHIQDVFTNHLVLIGMEILHDNIRIHKFQVVTDGEKREFSGETITKDFHEIIRAVKTSSSIDAILDYDHYHYTGFTICNNKFKAKEYADMFDIKEYIENGVDEYGNKYLDGLFYSIYSKADCSEDSGAIIAYGEKNGHLYTGDIESKIITDLPDGVWHSLTTTVMYDAEDIENIDEIESICEQMMKFSSYIDLTTDENSISFGLYETTLNSKVEFIEFVELCQKFLKATNGESSGADNLHLVNFASDDVRILNVKITEDGTHEISIQSTDF